MNAESEDRELLAGEYVLGVLAPAEQQALAARIEREPELAAAVARWELRFDALADGAAPVVPPPRAAERIMAIVAAEPRRGPTADAADARPQPAGWWNSLLLWRSLSGTASIALAAVLVLANPQAGQPAGLPPSPPDAVADATRDVTGPPAALPIPPISPRATVAPPVPAATVVPPVPVVRERATRGAAGGAATGAVDDSIAGLLAANADMTDLWVVRYDSARQRLQVRSLNETRSTPGTSFELWVVLPDQPPQSLGVLSSRGRGSVAVPADILAALPSAQLAVSVEPLGGSTTGAPTGPIVLHGRTIRF